MVDESFNFSCTVERDNRCCFEALTDDELLLLENNKAEVTYKKGEIICKQGTFVSHVMFLCKGLAKIYVDGNNSLLTLKVVSPGNLIGLTSVHSENSTFQYSAMAYQDSVVRLFDINTIRKLIRQNSLFAAEIINILCDNSNQVNFRFYSFQNKQSYGRLADVLLCLSDRVFRNKDFTLNVSRQELADIAGMSREGSTRILRKFIDDKLIELNGKSISILDEKTLRKISNYG